MASTSGQNSCGNKSSKEIRRGFKSLLKDYREKSKELSKLEAELQEHKTVVESLIKENGNRKCFHKINGFLCERPIKDVLPDLIIKLAELEDRLDYTKDYLAKQGDIIQAYRAKYNMELSVFSTYRKFF